jgi:hypothetical protein
MDNILNSDTEIITTTRGDVVVSNTIPYADIPVEAYYATRESEKIYHIHEIYFGQRLRS